MGHERTQQDSYSFLIKAGVAANLLKIEATLVLRMQTPLRGQLRTAACVKILYSYCGPPKFGSDRIIFNYATATEPSRTPIR